MPTPIVTVCGGEYDYIAKNADLSRRSFADDVSQILRAVPGVVDVAFVFNIASCVVLPNQEHFLIEIRGLSQVASEEKQQIQDSVAASGSKRFSYNDCDNHDSWSILRKAICRIL